MCLCGVFICVHVACLHVSVWHVYMYPRGVFTCVRVACVYVSVWRVYMCPCGVFIGVRVACLYVSVWRPRLALHVSGHLHLAVPPFCVFGVSPGVDRLVTLSLFHVSDKVFKGSLSSRESQISGLFSSSCSNNFLHCPLACTVCNEEPAVILRFLCTYVYFLPLAAFVI